MGYTTDFKGAFQVHKYKKGKDHIIYGGRAKLDRKTANIINTLAKNDVRELHRKTIDDCCTGDKKHIKLYEQLDFIIDGVQLKSPPNSYFCQWCVTQDEDGDIIEWDGNEKFYDYKEWLEIILGKILIPNGYYLTGEVVYQGEGFDDRGVLSIGYEFSLREAIMPSYKTFSEMVKDMSKFKIVDTPSLDISKDSLMLWLKNNHPEILQEYVDDQ